MQNIFFVNLGYLITFQLLFLHQIKIYCWCASISPLTPIWNSIFYTAQHKGHPSLASSFSQQCNGEANVFVSGDLVLVFAIYHRFWREHISGHEFISKIVNCEVIHYLLRSFLVMRAAVVACCVKSYHF